MPKKRSVKAVKVVRISDDADLFKMTSGLGSDYSSVLLFTDTRAVHCPDGTPRFVYRNLDRAFPLFAHDWNATIGGVVNGLRNLQAKVGVDAKKNVVQLYEGLGKLNAALEQNYRANYTVFASDPCAPGASENLAKANAQVRKATNILLVIDLELSRAQPDVNRLQEYEKKLTDLLLES